MSERETILSLVRLEDGSLTMEILPDHEQYSLAIVPDEKLFTELARILREAIEEPSLDGTRSFEKQAKAALDELIEGWESMQGEEEKDE
jgi:hypothetical protein